MFCRQSGAVRKEAFRPQNNVTSDRGVGKIWWLGGELGNGKSSFEDGGSCDDNTMRAFRGPSHASVPGVGRNILRGMRKLRVRFGVYDHSFSRDRSKIVGSRGKL